MPLDRDRVGELEDDHLGVIGDVHDRVDRFETLHVGQPRLTRREVLPHL